MTWARDQKIGFFGYDGEGQMLHRVKVDVDEAMEATKDVRTAWLRAQQHPSVPAFSGGLLDCWAARMVDGFAICTAEKQLVDHYRASLRVKEK